RRSGTTTTSSPLAKVEWLISAPAWALAAAPTSATTSNRILATLIIRLALINCAAPAIDHLGASDSAHVIAVSPCARRGWTPWLACDPAEFHMVDPGMEFGNPAVDRSGWPAGARR